MGGIETLRLSPPRRQKLCLHCRKFNMTIRYRFGRCQTMLLFWYICLAPLNDTVKWYICNVRLVRSNMFIKNVMYTLKYCVFFPDFVCGLRLPRNLINSKVSIFNAEIGKIVKLMKNIYYENSYIFYVINYFRVCTYFSLRVYINVSF